ncbi:hypothetical protein B0T11DRAFT_298891 [Plectosphaerella cucumerina]|uniref:Uncharacterized protein n=1 Tax=Plectosphaerella cucumerina TaxID=40658 RepID=A0A8K0TCM9_9PEZI|nr:hypothetical protein B0T11DRAFT_298891 [Plectosphaerella cucumerina]
MTSRHVIGVLMVEWPDGQALPAQGCCRNHDKGMTSTPTCIPKVAVTAVYPAVLDAEDRGFTGIFTGGFERPLDISLSWADAADDGSSFTRRIWMRRAYHGRRRELAQAELLFAIRDAGQQKQKATALACLNSTTLPSLCRRSRPTGNRLVTVYVDVLVKAAQAVSSPLVVDGQKGKERAAEGKDNAVALGNARGIAAIEYGRAAHDARGHGGQDGFQRQTVDPERWSRAGMLRTVAPGGRPPNRRYFSPLLVNAILTVATFRRETERLWQAEEGGGGLLIIPTLILLDNWSKANDKEPRGYYYLSRGIEQAYGAADTIGAVCYTSISIYGRGWKGRTKTIKAGFIEDAKGVFYNLLDWADRIPSTIARLPECSPTSYRYIISFYYPVNKGILGDLIDRADIAGVYLPEEVLAVFRGVGEIYFRIPVAIIEEGRAYLSVDLVIAETDPSEAVMEWLGRAALLG